MKLAARALRVDAATFARSHGVSSRTRVHLRLARHAVLNFVRHGHESLLNVRRILRRRLYERDPNLIRERLRRRVIHHLLTRQVALIPHQQLVHIFVRVAIDLVQPSLHRLKTLHVGHIVHDDDAVRAAVVRRRDRPKSFLPRGVPNLKLDRLTLQLHSANLKINHDRRDIRPRVRIVREAKQQTRLTDARVADELRARVDRSALVSPRVSLASVRASRARASIPSSSASPSLASARARPSIPRVTARRRRAFASRRSPVSTARGAFARASRSRARARVARARAEASVVAATRSTHKELEQVIVLGIHRRAREILARAGVARARWRAI